jgi:repressor LexA
MQTRTRRQREVLEFISRYIDSHGFEPSYQLIARHLGINSKAGVAKHIRALELQGLLKTRNEKGQFTLEITYTEPPARCEQEIEWLDPPADDWPEGWDLKSFSFPSFLLGPLSRDRVIAFRVPDSSMEGDLICEGDVVLLEQRSFVRDGDIVAARIKEAPPVFRRFYRNGSKVELRCSEDDEKPITSSADKVKVLGVYRGLVRPVK